MNVEDVRTVAVIGSGLMGSGIAQVFAQKGYNVKMNDVSEEFLQRGMGMIQTSLRKFVEKGRITQDQASSTLQRIKTTTNLKEAVEGVDLMVEAVTENMTVKRKVFEEADKAAPPHAVFASNTSTLSITEMGSVTKRTQLCVGMHFFNPPQLMKMVEVVQGLTTSEDTVKLAKALVVKLDKTPIVAKDTPGFVANRIFFPMVREAITLLEQGVATKEDIDTAMKLGFNHPMGPLELSDYVGLDTTLYAMEAVHQELSDPRYAPPLLLKQLVKAGYLGRKSGRGFYEY